MTKTEYCPLMLIGFAPPGKENEIDMRTCHQKCKWYNVIEEDCNINVIANNLSYMTDENIEDYSTGYYDAYEK